MTIGDQPRSTTAAQRSPAGAGRTIKLGFVEFVALMAGLMAVSSMSIDNLLPAFGPIGHAMNIADANNLQLLVYVYMISFGAMQLVYGPLSDAIGRRPAVLGGLAIYLVGAVMATMAQSFTVLLIARVIQGFGAASARVISLAIVRDHYEGREMARVMSFTMMVFILVPMFAPTFGSLFVVLGGWRLVFGSMIATAVIVMAWFGFRMPETLHAEHRYPLSTGRIVDGFVLSMTTRATIGYATAGGLMFGCIMAYVGSADQIFQTSLYDLGHWFPLVFAIVAMGQAAAALVNSRLVRRLGTRRISHAGVIGFLLFSTIQLGLAINYDGHPPLLAFVGLLLCCTFLFGLTAPNFNAMAMEPLGAIAGTASSFLGFYMTLMGAAIGLVVGRAFNGTVTPLILGFFTLGLLSLLVIFWTEKGRLFRPHHPEQDLA